MGALAEAWSVLVFILGLKWVQLILWIVYAIYFIMRTYHIWEHVSEYGIRKGYRRSIMGYQKILRLSHIIRTAFDSPSYVIACFFPFIRSVFTLKVYEFKDEEDKKVESASLTRMK